MMIKFKYTGAGEFYGGVPARDLTEADWAGLGPDQRKLVIGGGLYAEELAKAVTTNEKVKKSSEGRKKGRSKKESA